MKKIYAFLAAALISVSAFASRDVVPEDAVLADYYEAGQVCVCFFVPADMACYDIVLTGKFNDWSSTIADCVPCEPLEGYDGWYVAAFTPEATPDAEKGIQAKPVMKDANGAFSWNYQVGAATVIRGGVQVVSGLPGEIDLVNYGTDAPNVFAVDSWKQNPCTAVYHNYTFVVVSDGCDLLAVPFIVGGFTDWKFQRMQVDQARSVAEGAPVYTYTAKLPEGEGYQIVNGLMDPATGEMDSTAMPGWNDDSYLQVYVDSTESWVRIPGESGDNLLTHADAEIVFDIRVDTLRWGRCDGLPVYDVVVYLKAPAGAPDTVQIIGSYDGWKGQNMTWNPSTDYYEATVQAKETNVFKFRSGVGEDDQAKWDNQIEYYDTANDEWLTFGDGHEDLVFGELWGDADAKQIVLDFSDAAAYRWKAGAQGIENVVLTEQAQKVIVDGVLYIVRDNKMFNVQGTQVR